MTILPSSTKVQMRKSGSGPWTTVGANMARGPVSLTQAPRTVSRPTARGKAATRSLGVYDTTVSFDVLDNAAARDLFQWFGGNGLPYEALVLIGSASGDAQIALAGPLTVEGQFNVDRQLRISLTASGDAPAPQNQ